MVVWRAILRYYMGGRSALPVRRAVMDGDLTIHPAMRVIPKGIAVTVGILRRMEVYLY